MTTSFSPRPPSTQGNTGGRGPVRRGRRHFPQRRRVCSLCVDKVKTVDYKNIPLLRRYISERAKIDSRRRRGTCAKHQRMVSSAIKRARHLALLPFTGDHVRETGWRP
ncbi:30S ribosomal protein S18 [SAR202 cluster bacterium AD-802-E10_MRT_200m]|nr:30S ribosomal protein S18 [SAR202 cluster bacterium AD-802-E10_MRT_200m]